ncbi:MAG TPA: hypothetical protein VF482_15625 [Trebonia sp.]
MTNMYAGIGSDDMPTAPYRVSGTGSGGPGGRRPRGKLLAALLVTCVVAGGGAFAVAQAATSQPSQAGTGISQAANSHTANSQVGQAAAATRQVTVLRQVLGSHRWLARLRLLGGMYGQYTFETKQGPRTLAFERGTITSVGGSDVSVRATDGTTWTWTLTGTSVVRDDGKRMPASTLRQGQAVFTGGPVTGGTRDARLIVIRDQEQRKTISGA